MFPIIALFIDQFASPTAQEKSAKLTKVQRAVVIKSQWFKPSSIESLSPVIARVREELLLISLTDVSKI